MKQEQIVVALEAVDPVAMGPARDGDAVQFGMRGDGVTAKLSSTGQRIGVVRSAELLDHLRHGGQARGRLERALAGALVVCTLVEPH